MRLDRNVENLVEKLVGHDAYCLHLLPSWLFLPLPDRAVEGKVSKREVALLHLANLHWTVPFFVGDLHRLLRFPNRFVVLRGPSGGCRPMRQNRRNQFARCEPSALRRKVAELLAWNSAPWNVAEIRRRRCSRYGWGEEGARRVPDAPAVLPASSPSGYRTG